VITSNCTPLHCQEEVKKVSVSQDGQNPPKSMDYFFFLDGGGGERTREKIGAKTFQRSGLLVVSLLLLLLQ
jgi:hypothetical protein